MAFGIDDIIDATETTTGEAGLDMLAEAVANSGIGKTSIRQNSPKHRLIGSR